jgi:hypothetical protein
LKEEEGACRAYIRKLKGVCIDVVILFAEASQNYVFGRIFDFHVSDLECFETLAELGILAELGVM